MMVPVPFLWTLYNLSFNNYCICHVNHFWTWTSPSALEMKFPFSAGFFFWKIQQFARLSIQATWPILLLNLIQRVSFQVIWYSFILKMNNHVARLNWKISNPWSSSMIAFNWCMQIYKTIFLEILPNSDQ